MYRFNNSRISSTENINVPESNSVEEKNLLPSTLNNVIFKSVPIVLTIIKFRKLNVDDHGSSYTIDSDEEFKQTALFLVDIKI
ncbi:hypothetical protein BLA29_007695 [Euroglyphus maynei]|uniref:Uncharacterized protein n=1 Tax=Euroglyphus maynei TaxID=6958 RepID=A0A1Y3AQD7_EURMA|nr:hypothetical protein BLA29_007695 [Euroglyphus maynei]